MLRPSALPLVALSFALAANSLPTLKPRNYFIPASQAALFNSKAYLADSIKGAMLGSIRTRCVSLLLPRESGSDFWYVYFTGSWEQGTAAAGVLEIDYPQYSVFADSPFTDNGMLPAEPLLFALSAAVRQGPLGQLSQEINDAEDGAALDGASAGPYVLLGATWITGYPLSHTLTNIF